MTAVKTTERDPQHKPWLASFGRRRGRKLNPHKAGLLETLLPGISVCVEGQGTNTPEVLARENPAIWLEIGFGGGEHLAGQASRNPDVLCIGCEPYIDGVAALLAEVEGRKLPNVRILADDARLLLEALPERSLERVFILFPDPWPKTRHHKRRIVSVPTLNLIARALKPGGELRLTTDHIDYSTWMLEHVLAQGDFEWMAKQPSDWLEAPEDWVPTRYEAKTRAEGRAPVYYLFRRR